MKFYLTLILCVLTCSSLFSAGSGDEKSQKGKSVKNIDYYLEDLLKTIGYTENEYPGFKTIFQPIPVPKHEMIVKIVKFISKDRDWSIDQHETIIKALGIIDPLKLFPLHKVMKHILKNKNLNSDSCISTIIEFGKMGSFRYETIAEAILFFAKDDWHANDYAKFVGTVGKIDISKYCALFNSIKKLSKEQNWDASIYAAVAKEFGRIDPSRYMPIAQVIKFFAKDDWDADHYAQFIEILGKNDPAKHDDIFEILTYLFENKQLNPLIYIEVAKEFGKINPEKYDDIAKILKFDTEGKDLEPFAYANLIQHIEKANLNQYADIIHNMQGPHNFERISRTHPIIIDYVLYLGRNQKWMDYDYEKIIKVLKKINVEKYDFLVKVVTHLSDNQYWTSSDYVYLIKTLGAIEVAKCIEISNVVDYFSRMCSWTPTQYGQLIEILHRHHPSHYGQIIDAINEFTQGEIWEASIYLDAIRGVELEY